MNQGLIRARDFYLRLIEQFDRAIVGLNDAKEKTGIALLSELSTSWNEDKRQRVNSAPIMYCGVPGTGKTYLCVVTAACTHTGVARIQGRSDMMPTEIVGIEVWNQKTGEWEERTGPIVDAGVILLDEVNRIPPKTQSAFLEPLNDRTVTIGKKKFNLPAFCFPMATRNAVETGEGTYPLSAAHNDRFAMEVQIGYLPKSAEHKLVQFDIKKIDIDRIVEPDDVLELRAVIHDEVYLHPDIEKYIVNLVDATRPADTRRTVENPEPIPSVCAYVDGEDDKVVASGAGPRATMMWGRLAQVRALVAGNRDTVFPEDIQALAKNVLCHRIALEGKARVRRITPEKVIEDIVSRVPVP